MGACQQFEAHILGVGGHAAMPHTVVDPIVAAASTISALQASARSSERFSYADGSLALMGSH